ncbi:hypothetical protein JAAARDRAFT_566596 [Jaapia argillacea MUCL 33604]|uniref:G protein gamma domain-containing protein n=1 Tax=Jaapia argillacea MUCL 33604 TaxID=933084 RepID=A0A067QE93_9AGAM|nr:hypothetical protein JAAARDRAFT_566596 [Jaapia argillacea MUCL 33604]
MDTRRTKQSMGELKLRRLVEHNQRLREDLSRPRIRVSEASSRYMPLSTLRGRSRSRSRFSSLIRYCKTTKDHLVPSVWGPVGRAEDPYGQQAAAKCCTVQ